MTFLILYLPIGWALVKSFNLVYGRGLFTPSYGYTRIKSWDQALPCIVFWPMLLLAIGLQHLVVVGVEGSDFLKNRKF